MPRQLFPGKGPVPRPIPAPQAPRKGTARSGPGLSDSELRQRPRGITSLATVWYQAVCELGTGPEPWHAGFSSSW
eukprot:878597-Rhodomonas_salina.1